MNQNNNNYITTMLEVKTTDQTRCGYFTVKSNLSKEQGRKIAYEFSKNNQTIKVIFNSDQKFWVIRHPQDQTNKEIWQNCLNNIAKNLQSEIGTVDLTIDNIKKVDIIPHEIISQLKDGTRFGHFMIKSQLKQSQGLLIAQQFCEKTQHFTIFNQQRFFIIINPKGIKSQEKWQNILNEIKNDLRNNLGKLDLTIDKFQKPDVIIPPEVLAELASRLINPKVRKNEWIYQVQSNNNQIIIYRYMKITTETFDHRSAIGLNWKTTAKYKGTMRDFWIANNRNNECLLNLEVKHRFFNISGIIVDIKGVCNKENKQQLLSYPDLYVKTREIIEKSDENDLIVSVKTKRSGKDSYANYVINGLEIAINQENSSRFGLDYNTEYRPYKNIKLSEWQELMKKATLLVNQVLQEWGLLGGERCINGKTESNYFAIASYLPNDVKLKFGNNFISNRGALKAGLKHGVYQRYSQFSNPEISIKTVILNLSKLQENNIDNFFNKIKNNLKSINFTIELFKIYPIPIDGKMSESDAVKIEEILEKILAFESGIDLVITILPKGDQKLDFTEKGSYYHHVYGQLLQRDIVSQMVKEESVSNPYILNNLILGILAKLGNLPFVLAESLPIADYFIGLDVARDRKIKLGGTVNACACVRMYGNKGEFIKYKLADSTIEGEEIPAKVLRNLLPLQEFQDRKVVIFRDGRFRGKEIETIKERGEALKAQFILIEITKRGASRLFNYQINPYNNKEQKSQINLYQPTQYLYFKHSERSVTIVTTTPPEKIGIASPIRITIRPEGIIPPLEDVIESTIKMSLLHHGSYKEPGIPMPIYSSDKIGYLTLKGLYHTKREGDRPWWF
jgi:hypothetical protein